MEDDRKIKCMSDVEKLENTSEVPIEPCRANCKICSKEVTTFVKTEFNNYLIIWVIFVLHFFPIYIILPLFLITMPLFRNVLHSCPYCFDILLENKFYTVKAKENYVMLNYGKCMFIFRQIYVWIFLILLFSYGFYYNITEMFAEKTGDHHKVDYKKEIDYELTKSLSNDLTWESLIRDCGAKVMIDNSARANEIFNKKYSKKVIEWKGYFINAYTQKFSPFDFNPQHLVNINVRMIPSESLNDSDLLLSLDYNTYMRYSGVIIAMESGTPIQFKAEFESIGNEWRPHHLHLHHIKQTEDFIDKEHKIILFQGINFNITGHLQLDKDIQELKSKIAQNNTLTVLEDQPTNV